MPHDKRSSLVTLAWLVGLTGAALCVMSGALPRHAQAQARDARAIKTQPPDLGYGVQQGEPVGRWLWLTGSRDPSRRRQRVDARPGQGVLLPNAYTPDAGTLRYTSTLLLLGHTLEWSPHKRVMLGVTWTPPPRWLLLPAFSWDQHAALSARVAVWEDRDWRVAAAPLLFWRKGTREYDSAELGAGLRVMVDRAIHPRVVVGAGLMGYTPLRHTFTYPDASQCITREDYNLGYCINPTSVQENPRGGKWFGAWAHLTWYIPEGWHLKAELFTGAAKGTMWHLEGGLFGGEDYATIRERYTQDTWRWGAPDGVPLVFNAGLGWSDGRLGGFAGFVTTPGRTRARAAETDRALNAPLALPFLALSVQL